MKLSDFNPRMQRQIMDQLVASKPLPPPTEKNVKRLVNPNSAAMNKTEAAWFGILVGRGYKHIHVQDINLRVGKGRCFYRPDFFVADINTFYEVKGAWIMDDGGMVKLKAAALQYPAFRWIMAQKIKGDWIEKVIHDPAQQEPDGMAVEQGRKDE